MKEDKIAYRKMRNDINIHLTNKEAATFLALMFCSDFNTGESHVIHKTLTDMTGFPESTLKRYLNKLKGKGFIETKSYYNGVTQTGDPRHLTDYITQMPDIHYIMVSRTLLDMQINELPLKHQSAIKGFLLMLKCVCLNFTDTTLYSYRKMEKHMNLSYSIIAGLMKQCIEYGLVRANKKGYTIKEGLFINGYPPMEIPESEQVVFKETYTAIYEFCKSKRVICPPYDHRLVGRIATFGNTPEMLKALYEKRIDHLPDNISSLNYFVRIIDGKVLEPEPERQEPHLLVD